MTLSLTCACGARLEIDDKFAGQQINCPDCNRALQAPARGQPGKRTSGLALASIVLALVGAFTIVGTVAAIVVGILALLQLANHGERLAGRGYAVAGIVLGVVFTGGTIFALSSLELFGLTSLMSDAYWSGKLDFAVPLEIVREREGFSIKRPSAEWGVYKAKFATNANDFDDRVLDDLLLVLPREDAVVLCFTERVGKHLGIESCRGKALEKLAAGDKVGLFSNVKPGVRQSWSTPTFTKRPPVDNGVEMIEMHFDRKQGSEDKSFLVRVLKKQDDDFMFVVVAACRRAHFARLETPLRAALDSFRLLDRNFRPNW